MNTAQSALILFPSKIRSFFALIASIGFLFIGSYVLNKGGLLGLFFVIPSAISIPICLGNLFSKYSYLELTEEGFRERIFVINRFTHWNEVGGFIALSKHNVLSKRT